MISSSLPRSDETLERIVGMVYATDLHVLDLALEAIRKKQCYCLTAERMAQLRKRIVNAEREVGMLL
jgi:hypothetical protein